MVDVDLLWQIIRPFLDLRIRVGFLVFPDESGLGSVMIRRDKAHDNGLT